jgi:PHD/YefM family antitoxin component YafN of YafNO toxin-antitoxin module
MNIRPVSKCQSNFNEVAELCRSEREPVFITRNGYEDLVLVRAQDYTRSIARLELYDKLAAAQRQIEAGAPVVSHEELFRELRERLNNAHG